MSSTANHTSPARLRQIALVSADLDRSKHLLTTVIGTEVVFVDPGVGQWGLKNILGTYSNGQLPTPFHSADISLVVVAVGGDVIEVVSPFKANTTAGRLLSKRGDGGYMIIMQTLDAAARRRSIEARGVGKVIYSHEHDDAVCIQYHPKGIPGGMMPELDSHAPSPANPDPLGSRFSRWHACGADYSAYSAGMKRCSDLHLVGAVCRLAPGNAETDTAARRWEEVFGVPRIQNELAFTNARMRFMPGVKGKPEGLESVTIAVEGEERMAGILERARKEGLCGDVWINMVGVKWYFVQAGHAGSHISDGGRHSHL